MDIKKNKELWDRLENEPERAYRAFECFLGLPGGERTMLEAYRRHVGNPDAGKVSDTWSRWSNDFAWRERAAAYDDHLASLRREAHEQVIKEEAARQAREVEEARGRYNELMTNAYNVAMEWLEDAQRSDLRAQDVIKIIGLHQDYLKAFEVDQESTREGGWTEEDEAAVADIVKEVDALADPEYPGEAENSGKDSGEDGGSQEGPIY